MATTTATTTTSDGLAVTVSVEPAPANPEHIADLALLWGLFFAAALVVFLARRLLDLFRVNHHED